MSFAEPWLDTDQRNPVRGLLLAIFSWIAEAERIRRSERTKRGLDRVRQRGSKSGKPIGRPPRLDAEGLTRVRELRAAGRSIRSIAMAVGVPRATTTVTTSPGRSLGCWRRGNSVSREHPPSDPRISRRAPAAEQLAVAERGCLAGDVGVDRRLRVLLRFADSKRGRALGSPFFTPTRWTSTSTPRSAATGCCAANSVAS